MLSFFYDFFLFLGTFVFSLYEKVFKKKKRKFLLERWGIRKLKIPHGKKDFVVWVHAVSVGEAKAATSLVDKIKQEKPSSYILFSSTTDRGHEEAKKCVKADAFIIFPYDFSWTMKKLLKKIKPKIVILVETDFWYHFLKYAKKYGATILLVNGKMSKNSFRLFNKVSFLTKKLFSFFDLFCVQSEAYRQKFLLLGIPKEKVFVTGNLKYKADITFLQEEEKNIWKKNLGITDQIVITIASTHPKEEALLLPEVIKLKNPKILLAPRHPERCPSVETLLQEQKISYVKLSEIEKQRGDEIVILIDRMGFLPTCFQLSSLAIVAGSFISHIGGHNILEPVFYSVPVFFGPFMFNQQEFKDKVLKANCGKEVKTENLERELSSFLQDKLLQETMRKNCQLLTSAIAKEGERTWEVVKSKFV